MTKASKAKPARGKYSAKFIDLVPMLVLKCGMINSRGEIAWTQVATFLRVSTESIRRWRDPTDVKMYKEDFAAAVEKLTEEVDTERTKRSQIEASRKHTLHRRNFEMVDQGPMRPKWGWTKKVLLRYAWEVLGLDLPKKMANPEIEYEILWELKQQTSPKRRETSSSRQEVDPNPEAVKRVLTNMGDPEHRWNLKDQIEGPLTSIEISYHEIKEDPNAGKTIEDGSES